MKDAPAQFLGSDRQASTLVVVKTQPLASKLFAQDAVLFLKIVDNILLSLVQPACEGNEEQPKRIHCQAHYAMIVPEGAFSPRAKPCCLSHSAFSGIDFLDTTGMIREAVKTAEKCGIRMAIENHIGLTADEM